MVTHMKTTIDIADGLLAEAKRAADREGTTLRALVEDGLRRVLAERTTGRLRFKLKDASFRGRGLQPGVREGNWDQVRDLVYESRGA